ncbi:MAG: hypothetical protein AUG51_19835 [Acidobacteria bacterium 13_1_20CM_3_53_8]|nr:MAG: hypothetical protein AUG51_19835 [Acidobacteria bacterium 13_1_20CM_3_53_8]
MKILLTAAVAIVFLTIGIRCLFWPQQVALRHFQRGLRGPMAVKEEDIPRLINSPINVLIIRIFGLLCIGAFIACMYGLIRGLP